MMNENNPEHEEGITPHDQNITPQDETNPPQENPHHPDADTAPQVAGETADSSTEYHWIDRSGIDELRSRWTAIQSQFVDQPCTAIEQGDTLVAETIEKLQTSLTDLHSRLRERWYNTDDASTEDLRLTLQEYRSLFNRLLDL